MTVSINTANAVPALLAFQKELKERGYVSFTWVSEEFQQAIKSDTIYASKIPATYTAGSYPTTIYALL